MMLSDYLKCHIQEVLEMPIEHIVMWQAHFNKLANAEKKNKDAATLKQLNKITRT